MTRLLQYIEDEKIELIEDDIPIDKLKGLYYDGTIILDKNIKTNAEKKCVLAEEIGHHYTTSGNILNQNDINHIKQENRARNWAYEKLVGITDLINAYKHGCSNRFEIADYLNITEEFLKEAIDYYKRKLGQLFKIDNYIIYFEPLSILEIF